MIFMLIIDLSAPCHKVYTRTPNGPMQHCIHTRYNTKYGVLYSESYLIEVLLYNITITMTLIIEIYINFYKGEF